MWQRQRKFIAISITIYFLLIPINYAEISTGIRVYNNQWHETWLITPAPVLTFSSKWMALQFDGTFGTYSPQAAPYNYIIQSRFSMIPMLRLKVGPIESGLGYGYAYQFSRNEILNKSDQWEFSSLQENSGEFRFLIGLGFSVSDHLNFHVNGGYHYLNQNNLAYSFGMSIGFKQSISEIPEKESVTDNRPSPDNQSINTVERSDSQPAIEITNQTKSQVPELEPKATAQIKTVCLIGTQDKFINEINASLEAALIKNGTSVLSWDKIKVAVRKHHQKMRIEESNGNSSYDDRDDFFMNDMQIFFNGAELFALDAVIDTKLRYIYETYGEEILVNAAYIRVLHPKTGEILIAIEYDKPESSYSECKAALTTQLIQKLYTQN
ncbi:hypothetical protein HQ585_06770 [candidate division KSB1 bacterium]|nr:hypothetical protein [candidate division KSB1 bacterium]